MACAGDGPRGNAGDLRGRHRPAATIGVNPWRDKPGAMEIPGERKCNRCGARWSYYDTGSVNCPNCGSIDSVGVDEAKTHTDTPAELDLSEAKTVAAERTVREAADLASTVAGEYVRRRGFIRAGDLVDLDDEMLVAHELRVVADRLARALASSDAEEFYFVSLLGAGSAGERPGPGDVPDSLADARGLAYATAVDDYRTEVVTWLDDDRVDGHALDVLELIADHVRRIRALDGAVPPEDAERLVQATREVADYLREDDEGALSRARERLTYIG